MLPAFLKRYLSGQSSRNKSVLRNVGLGFAAKGLSILIGFIQIPVTLSILNKTEYGVWITIFSVTSWLSFFDIGMGNGFRNKLTEALAEGDTDKAKRITSTTYVSLGLIFTGIVLLFLPVSIIVPWKRVFQSPPELDHQLYWVVLFTIVATALNFVAGLIHTVLATRHRTGQSSMLFLIGQVAVLVLLYGYRLYGEGNAFLFVSLVIAGVPLLLNVGLNLWFFLGRFRSFAPSFAWYERKFLKELMSLGVMFFVIQIASVVMYTTDNIIITQLYSPTDVVTYSLVYKYYSIVSMAFAIVTMPLWTMYVDAYKKNDRPWIIKSVHNLQQFSYLCGVGLLIMLLVSGYVFRLWIGPDFNPSLLLEGSVALYILLLVWGNIWVLPLNAAGKIRVQMIVSALQAILNVPIILVANRIFSDLSSVVIGNIVCVMAGSAYMYFYYRKNFIVGYSAEMQQL